MTLPFSSAIAQVSAGNDLSATDMQQLIESMLQGLAPVDDVGRLLLALREKGEAVSELVGSARALRQHMTPIASCHDCLIDTCGTGGDGSGTFNISTAAAIVVAACGVPVAKHGNRKITSLTGSADVLRCLGVQVDAPRAVVERCLREAGICFCYAPALHPAMRHVAEVRQRLGVRTLFNLLGPLCNPAGATHQLLGTGDAALQTKLAEALVQLGITRGAVVRGEDGLDEVTLAGETVVMEITEGQIIRHRWSPPTFGLELTPLDLLAVDGPEQSAAVIRRVLEGNAGPARDIVLANAATALWLVGKFDSLPAATRAAAEAIDSGAARQTLSVLASLSQG